MDTEKLIPSLHLSDEPLHHLDCLTLLDNDPALQMGEPLDRGIIHTHFRIDQVDMRKRAGIGRGYIQQ